MSSNGDASPSRPAGRRRGNDFMARMASSVLAGVLGAVFMLIFAAGSGLVTLGQPTTSVGPVLLNPSPCPVPEHSCPASVVDTTPSTYVESERDDGKSSSREDCPVCEEECVPCEGVGMESSVDAGFRVSAVRRAGRFAPAGVSSMDLSMGGVLQLPYKDVGKTTVLLNLFRRPEYLPRQLDALLAQSIAPAAVWVCMFSVDAASKPQFEATVSRYRSKFASKGIEFKEASSDINFKYYGRFQLALQARTRYIWTIDDDILPQPKFHEAMLRVIQHPTLEAAVLGSSGWVLGGPDSGKGKSGGPKLRDYYKGAHLGAPDGVSVLTEADFLTTQQFCETQAVRAMFAEHAPTLETGEDIVLGHVARSRLHRRVYIMPCGGSREACGIQGGSEWVAMTQDKKQTTSPGSPAITARNAIIDYEMRRGRPALWLQTPTRSDVDSPPSVDKLAWLPSAGLRGASVSDVSLTGGVLVIVPNRAVALALRGIFEALAKVGMWAAVVVPESRLESAIAKELDAPFQPRAYGWFVLRADDDEPALYRPADVAAATLRGVAEILDNTRADVLLAVGDHDEIPPKNAFSRPLDRTTKWGDRKRAPAPHGGVTERTEPAGPVAAAAAVAAASQGVPVVATTLQNAAQDIDALAQKILHAAQHPQTVAGSTLIAI